MIMSIATTMIMAFSFQFIISFLFITTSIASPPPGGFTVDLIRRPSNSSSSRLSTTGDDPGASPYANTVFDSYEYLIKLQIGTPPVEIEAVLDTGSDLIWTQCLPCQNCYNQRAPIFDPSKSSTFKQKQCDNTPDGTCSYDIIYADKSYSIGTFATETVTIQSTSGEPFVMAETTIGCGHNNSGLGRNASGIIGLDWGALSLVSQLGDRFQGIFSYCFSGKGTSKINFGGNGIVAGDGTVSTTMFRRMEKPDFYYLNLDAISVGDTRIETLGTPFYSIDGNMMIDSGTTYTYLPESYCSQVKNAVESVVVQAVRLPYLPDMLCYLTNNIEIFPVITMHFLGGADLVLEKYNMYMDLGGIYCVTIMCVTDPTRDAIFGNRAQNNWLVGYDTSSQLVSFKSTDCSALWN